MNDTERLAKCAYALGFLTGGLHKAIELNDWGKVKDLEKYCRRVSEILFYDDPCLKSLNKSADRGEKDD